MDREEIKVDEITKDPSSVKTKTQGPIEIRANEVVDFDADVSTSSAGEKEATTATEIEFPDGGLRAWLVVVGSAFASFATFGYVTAWGAFQSYYEDTLLKDHSPSTIAWIGSIQYALVFLPALPVGRMFDLGYFRLPFLLSSTIVVVATFLTAQCKTFWQFLLCQGILQGAACGCTFAPILALIGQWFKKQRGLAIGLVTLGSSLGGTLFPIMTRRLIDEVGFHWALRILGFILLFVLAVPNLTLARRLPGKNVKGGLLNLAAFKFIPYTIWTAGAFVTFLGLYTTLTYIDIAAVEAGISPDFSFYLVAIANASSTLGRLSTGLFAQRFGPINFMAPTTLAAGILTYAWPFARTKGASIAVAVIYGAMTGSYVSAFMMPLFEMGEIHDIGRRSGMVLSVGAIGALIGPPISGAIKNSTGSFEQVGYYAGSTIVLAVILMLITKYLMIGNLWGKF
ncbi:MFS general substrate transporter [Marasmius fiardii PR-910]|nr:MFS general substrate transporter [Marasmius fiardii PR-910]